MATPRHEEHKTREVFAGNPYESSKVPAKPAGLDELEPTGDSKAPNPIFTVALGTFAIGISLLMAYGFFTIYSQSNRLSSAIDWVSFCVGILGSLSFLLLAAASFAIAAMLLYQKWYEN